MAAVGGSVAALLLLLDPANTTFAVVAVGVGVGGVDVAAVGGGVDVAAVGGGVGGVDVAAVGGGVGGVDVAACSSVAPAANTTFATVSATAAAAAAAMVLQMSLLSRCGCCDN